MTINEAKETLKENEIPVMESIRKGYDYFIPDTMDDVPLSDEENEISQAFGIHMTETELIEFSMSL